MSNTPEKESNALGPTLRSLRKNSQLGLKPAAVHLKMSYTYLSKIENGYKPPSHAVLLKLCELYGADPDTLIAKLGRLPVDVQEIVRKNGKAVFELLREKYLTEPKAKRGGKK